MIQISGKDSAKLMEIARKGIDALISFSQVYVEQDKKNYHSKATSSTSSFAIEQNQLIGTLDTMESHEEKQLEAAILYTTQEPQTVLKHIVLKSPVLLVRDRDAIFVETRRHFIDVKGRSGYAWYRTSTDLSSVSQSHCIRAQIKSWGSVFMQVTPHVLTRFAILDIEWNGSMPSWVGSHMTTRQMIATAPRPTSPSKRCSICYTKPRLFDKSSSKLKECSGCSQIVCDGCYAKTSVCLSCTIAKKSSRSRIDSHASVSETVISAVSNIVVDTIVTPRQCNTTSHLQQKKKIKEPFSARNLRVTSDFEVTDLSYVTKLYPGV